LSTATVRQTAQPAYSNGGFTIIEILIVLAIAMIVMATALPTINNTLSNMHVSSSANSLVGAIQSARYQAISTGCPINFVVSTTPVASQANELSYQLQTEFPLVGIPPTCGTLNTLSAVPMVPYANSDVTLVSATPGNVLTLNPSGTIGTGGTATTVGSSTPQNFSFVLSLANGSATRIVNVSGVGDVRIQ
jgi:Tfp pilus assembly protein FimT